jgi:hypothetical protein
MTCVKTFKKFCVEDFDTWEEWLGFVHENERYCREESTVNDYVGKCSPADLPSVHPFWSKRIRDNIYNTMINHIKNYSLCEDQPDLIKVYYNRDTTLSGIKDKIDKCKIMINNYDRIIRED